MTYVRSDPADPGEIGECGEEITGEEVPREGAHAGVDEEPLTADAAAVASASVLGLVQRVEEGAVHQVGRPD